MPEPVQLVLPVEVVMVPAREVVVPPHVAASDQLPFAAAVKVAAGNTVEFPSSAKSTPRTARICLVFISGGSYG